MHQRHRLGSPFSSATNGLQGALGAVGRGAFPVEAGAEAGQDLGHVPDEIIGNLGVVNYNQGAASELQHGFDHADAKAGQPVPVLEHQRVDRGVSGVMDRTFLPRNPAPP